MRPFPLLAIGYLTLGIFQGIIRTLMYFPSHHDLNGRGGDGFSPFKTSADEFLGYIKTHPKPRFTVVVFHGNAGEALDRSWYALALGRAPVTLILAEYPGYGTRTDAISESAIFKSADAVIAQAQRRGQPLIIVGESLGTGVACRAASRHQIHRLALISPFSSLVDVAEHHYAFFPVRFLIADRYESTLSLPKYNGPLHVIHGTDDEVVPIALGRRLFESYAGRSGEFTELQGFHHNDMARAIIDSHEAARFRTFIRGDSL